MTTIDIQRKVDDELNVLEQERLHHYKLYQRSQSRQKLSNILMGIAYTGFGILLLIGLVGRIVLGHKVEGNDWIQFGVIFSIIFLIISFMFKAYIDRNSNDAQEKYAWFFKRMFLPQLIPHIYPKLSYHASHIIIPNEFWNPLMLETLKKCTFTKQHELTVDDFIRGNINNNLLSCMEIPETYYTKMGRTGVYTNSNIYFVLKANLLDTQRDIAFMVLAKQKSDIFPPAAQEHFQLQKDENQYVFNEHFTTFYHQNEHTTHYLHNPIFTEALSDFLKNNEDKKLWMSIYKGHLHLIIENAPNLLEPDLEQSVLDNKEFLYKLAADILSCIKIIEVLSK